MRILLILLCLFLNACVVAPEPTPAAVPEQDTEMRDAIQAPIKKAEKVEDQVIDGAEKQRADIEAAGG
ncbi:MAG: hypothetical protein ACREPB_14985 [Arenimonas sp.]